MSTGPKNSWGGKRAGAGRPLGSGGRGRTLSQEAVERALDVSARFTEKYGMNTDELLHCLAYGVDFAENVSHALRLKAIEKIHERTTPKIKEGGIADTHGNPPAILPERMPDPAKLYRLDRTDSEMGARKRKNTL